MINYQDFGMGDRAQVWSRLIGPGIFAQDGADWKHSRSLLRPLFFSKRDNIFFEIQESVQALIKCFPEGKVVDLQPLFFRFTLDTATYLLFGRSIKSLTDESGEAEAFGDCFRVSQEYLADRGRLGPLHWMLNSQKFQDANATVHKWVDHEIKTPLAAYNAEEKEFGIWVLRISGRGDSRPQAIERRASERDACGARHHCMPGPCGCW